jgi:hypothetical protein
MKSKSIANFLFLAFVAGMFFSSCQKEATTRIDLPATGKILKSGPLPNCQTTYLNNGPILQETTSDTVKWGPLSAFQGYYRNNKYCIATAWNDTDYFYIQSDIYGFQYSQTGGKVKILNGPSNAIYPFTDVILTLNGISYTYSMDDPATTDIIETATTYTQAFPLPADWEACDEMVYTVRLEGDGQPVMFGTMLNPEYLTYHLYDYPTCTALVIATTECADLDPFEGRTTAVWEIEIGGYLYSAQGHHYLNLTYTPVVSGYAVIQGPLPGLDQVSFFGGDLACNYLPGDPNVVFAGNVTACQPYTIHLVWYSNVLSGDITGAWTADVYPDVNLGTSISHLGLDPMICDQTLTGD